MKEKYLCIILVFFVYGKYQNLKTIVEQRLTNINTIWMRHSIINRKSICSHRTSEPSRCPDVRLTLNKGI